MTVTTRSAVQAYVGRLRKLNDDELHEEGFEIAKAMREFPDGVRERWRMELVSAELARRDQPVTRKQIVDAIASEFGVPAEQIMSRSRTYWIATARQTAMWAIRQRIGLSSVAIGDFFNRDHSTVLHALRIVEHDHELRTVAERAIKSVTA